MGRAAQARDVAVKVLLADLAASPGLHTRFAREAEAAARLRHPNIIPIYQVGEAEGLAYIIMPLVQGESLRAVLQREGALPIPAARRILAEAARALEAAHKAGLVHRDVKPENIMLEGEERRVLLMDFGIARAMEEGSARLTGTGLVIGTPQYMSPEQATAEKHIDHRADIYSLGVVAYEALTGTLPFEAETIRDLIVHHLTKDPKDPRATRAEIPEDVADAILKCMAKEPGERWVSAGDVARIFQPAVTISEVSPLEWVRRRLRLGAHRSRRRIIVYATTLAAVLATLAIFNPRTIGVALFYWVDVVRHGLGGGEAAAPEAQTGRPDEPWNTRSRANLVRVGSLGDSAVLIAAPNQGVVAFDGSSWRTIPIPGVLASLPVIVARGGAAWIYAQQRRAVVGYELTPQGVSARDTIHGSLSWTWSDGREALLLMADGGVLRGQPGAWRREPTGVGSALDGIFGDSRRQVALGRFGGANLTDSLFLFNGLNWRGSDPRPDTTRVWKVNAGTALNDGTLILTGSERTDHARGLVARLPPNGTAWAPLPNMPDSVSFRRVIATGPREVWLAGIGSGCHDVTCLYRLVGDSAQPVAGFGQHGVIGFARLHGELVAATSGGLLWAYRAGQWGLLSEIPGSLGRGVFPESESGWSSATVLTERAAGIRRAVEVLLPGREAEWFDRKPMVFYSLPCVAGESVVVGVAAAYDNMAFILDDQMRVVASDDDSRGRYNALVRWRCPDDRRYRLGVRGFGGTETGPYQLSVWRGTVRDTTRRLSPSSRPGREIALDATVSGALTADATRAVAWLSDAGVIYQTICDVVGRCGAPQEAAAPEAIGDIAALGTSFIAAGTGRVYRRADQRWQPMAAEAPMGAIIALASAAGMAAALTPDAVWRAAATQATWRRWHRLPGWLGQPRLLALSPDGRAAIVVGEQSIALLSDSADPTEIRQPASGTPDDVLFLPDGRIVFSLTSRDPLVGGDLVVQAAGSAQRSPQRLPEHRNIRGLSTDGRMLYVAASGWATLAIELKNLPHAPADSAATPSP